MGTLGDWLVFSAEKMNGQCRPLFTDGFNSVAHIALGFLLGEKAIIPMALYQYAIKPDANSTVDMMEYLIGFGLAVLKK